MLRVFFWITVFATLLLFGQSFAGATGPSAEGDFGHTLMLFMHQLLLVYWLGPDIAVYIWSRRAVNTGLDVEQRITAGNMMTMIDIVPRVCLSLFLTVAGLLSETYGLVHPWWQMVAIVLLGPVWLMIVLMSYLKRGSDFGDLAMRFDLWLRGMLVVGIPLSVAWSVSTDRLAGSPWVAGKLMILALVILLGLIMRLRIRGVFAGLATMAADGPSEDLDTRISASYKQARPLYYAIWLLLLWASLMGVVKPGEQVQADHAAEAQSISSVRSLSSWQ